MKSTNTVTISLALCVAALGCASKTTAPPAAAAAAPTISRTNEAPLSLEDARKNALDSVGALVHGDIDAVYGRLDAHTKSNLSREAFARTWAALSKQLGALDHFEDPKTSIADADDYAVCITAVFVAQTADFLFKISKRTGEFGTFRIQPRTGSSVTYQAPSYVDRSAFEEREVRVNGLPATITKPHGEELRPVVILVHGSGPLDRDEAHGGLRPFRDIAWGLASRGILVLRYEKRTYGSNAATLPKAISVDDEVTNDAVEAVNVAAREPGVDPKRVILLGHSLGAMLAPRIAQKSPNVTGMILLAPAARPLEDILLEQATTLGHVSAETLANLRAKVARVKSADLVPSVAASELPMNLPATYWLSLRGYDPVAEAKASNRPLLVMHGMRDMHATEDDFARWKAAFSSTKAIDFDGLNHFFVRDADTAAAYEAVNHIQPAVISMIVDWIKSQGTNGHATN